VSNEILTIEQEDVASTKVVERELLIDEQVAPIVVESPAVEVVTLERETHIVDEVPQISIITVGEQGPPGADGDTGASGAASGRVYFLDPTNVSDLAGYATAVVDPLLGAHTHLDVALTGTADVLIEEFATEPSEPSATSLPAGIATRVYHVNTGASNQVARVKTELYKCDADGSNETLLRSDYTENFSGSAVQELNHAALFPTAEVLTATQRLVFKLYGARVSGPGTCNLSVHFNDITELSFIRTTLPGAGTGGGVSNLGDILAFAAAHG